MKPRKRIFLRPPLQLVKRPLDLMRRLDRRLRVARSI
jgi:hypothetical protein